jgi:hypothetical protein
MPRVSSCGGPGDTLETADSHKSTTQNIMQRFLAFMNTPSIYRKIHGMGRDTWQPHSSSRRFSKKYLSTSDGCKSKGDALGIDG